MKDLNTDLTRARESRKAASNEMMQLVAETDGKLNEEQRARHAELEATVTECDGQIDVIERTLKVGPHSPKINDTLDLSEGEKRQYSFMKLIRALAHRVENPKLMDDVGFELECSRAIADNIEREPHGIYIPREVWRSDEKRTMVTATGDAGGYFVEEELRENMLIGMLRSASSVMRAGARVLPGLAGDLLLPKQSGAGQFYWLGTEETDVTESTQTVAQVKLSPKHGAAHTRFSRQALKQTSPAIEQFIRNDLTRITGLGIDLAALQGSGVGGEPLGVKNVTGVNKPTNFAAAIPTWAECMVLVGAIATDNALAGFGGGEDDGQAESVNWILEGQMASDLMAKAKDAGSGRFVLDMEGNAPRIGLWPAVISNQLTAGDVWLGNWADLLIGMWGDPDLIVNPFTNDTSGVIRLTLHQFVDAVVRHAESFGYNNDG